MHRTVEVDVPSLARVEGDGALHIKVQGDEIVDLRLEIFEPPRFFEAFLAGRHFSEVPDIVARICGICPVAYQMSAVHGMEELFGIEVPTGTRDLRRLLYMAEWIESHMLHVHLLAAPDYLGFDSAIEMAKQDRPAVERGLRLKRLGNDLMAVIGGREIHPISPRVGGFSKAPALKELRAFLPRLEDAAVDIMSVAEWVGGIPRPAFERPALMLALVHPDEYPINEGRVGSTEGKEFPAAEFEGKIEEVQVPHSNALHARLRGGGSYFVGPLARATLNRDRIGSLGRAAAELCGLRLPETDQFAAMAARVTETAEAIDQAFSIIKNYVEPQPSQAEVTPRAGTAAWITEAPRGMLYHRYEIDERGIITEAKIIPPTSQNLRHIEDDLRGYLPHILDRSEGDLAKLCETVVRNYDPCISCATHFLTVDLDRTPR